MSRWTEDSSRIGLPLIRDIDVEFEFVPIWIEDVERVSDRMIGRSDKGNVFGLEFSESSAQFLIRIPNFETNVIQTRLWPVF